MPARPIAALDAVYVQINSVSDESNGPPLAAFLAGVIEGLKQQPAQNAIIDLRVNSGGDNSLTTAFTKALPDALPPDGHIFILTSGNTFSAAIDTAAHLKYFGGKRVVITGEPMGDREQFWGEGGSALLPNSRLEIRYATALHDVARLRSHANSHMLFPGLLHRRSGGETVAGPRCPAALRGLRRRR